MNKANLEKPTFENSLTCRMWWWYAFGISVREHGYGYLTWLLKGGCLSCLVRMAECRGEQCPGGAQALWWNRKPVRTWTDTAPSSPHSKCGRCSSSSVVRRLGCSWCRHLGNVLPGLLVLELTSTSELLCVRARTHTHTFNKSSK